MVSHMSQQFNINTEMNGILNSLRSVGKRTDSILVCYRGIGRRFSVLISLTPDIPQLRKCPIRNGLRRLPW